MPHTPGPWQISGPMGKPDDGEPWFWVSAARTLMLRVEACADGFVPGENEANARLIQQAPELAAIVRALANWPTCDGMVLTDLVERAQAAAKNLPEPG